MQESKTNKNGISIIITIIILMFCFILAPGPPSNVSFPDVSFTTARIIWDTPEDPNGEILAYKVMFHLNNSQDHQFSKEFPASDRTFRYKEFFFYLPRFTFMKRILYLIILHVYKKYSIYTFPFSIYILEII